LLAVLPCGCNAIEAFHELWLIGTTSWAKKKADGKFAAMGEERRHYLGVFKSINLRRQIDAKIEKLDDIVSYPTYSRI
jgi:hypothetical protein